MANVNFPFSSSGPRRPPTPDELVNGFSCNPDRQLFNFMHWWDNGQIAAVLNAAGITPQDDNLNQLLEAIRALAPLIEEDTTLHVSPSGVASPEDPRSGTPFNLISSAMNWLRGFRIRPDRIVTIQVAAGEYFETGDNISLTHPDGLNIRIVGPALTGAFPVSSDLYTISDAAEDALARGRITAVVNVVNSGLFFGQSGFGLIANIYFRGNNQGIGASIGTLSGMDTANFGNDSPSTANIRDCWFRKFNVGIASRSSGRVSAFRVATTYNPGGGVLVNNGSYFLGDRIYSNFNGQDGVFAREASYVEISGDSSVDKNGRHGIYLLNRSGGQFGTDASSPTARANATYNVIADRGSYLRVRSADLNVDGVATASALAGSFSDIELESCTNLSGLSPTPGNTGADFGRLLSS